MGIVHAMNLGETSIVVEDIRVAGHVQISSLNVVVPDHIYLFLSPISINGGPLEGVEPVVSNGRWFVVIGRHYLVEVKVFSRGPTARVIHTTLNENVQLDYYEPEYWRNFSVPDSTAANYGWQNSRMLEPIAQGLGKLSASLTYYTSHPEKKEIMNVVQEIMVCEQVRSVDEGRNTLLSSLLLPWSPDVYQEAELHTVGGCAKTPFDYKWLSSDDSIVSVSVMGVVQAKRPGKASVKVVSVYDSLNFHEVMIEVAIPSSMVMLPKFPVETVVQSNLYAAVAMKTSNGDYFHKCDAFHLFVKWSTGSDSFVVLNNTADSFHKNQLKKVERSDLDHQAACSWISLYASSPGQAILHATFSKPIDFGYSRQILLKASASIASFLPVTLHQAGDGNKVGGYWFDLEKVGNNDLSGILNELFLVPGASLDVILVGGPRRWGKGVDFVETVDIHYERSPHNIEGLVYQVPILEGNGYRIVCQKAGNFTVVFKRGNLIGDDHPQPVVAKTRLHLECSFPSSIVVLADEPVNKLDVVQNAILADRGPGRLRSTPVTVANGRTIRVSAVGISMSGKAFANSSSVPLLWELKNCEDLASWDEPHDREVPVVGWERYLALKNASGQCVVRALVQKTLFNDFPSLSEKVLTDAISLQVVSTMQVYPDFCLLFFHPNAKMNLSVFGGSCLLDAVVNDSRIVEVLQPAQDLQCSRLTLVPKSVGSAVVTVYDVGLSPPLTAASVVKVADVDWIKIMSDDLISLREGSTISVVLLAGTNDGYTFDSSQYIYMNIHVHFEDQYIQLVDNHTLSKNDDGNGSASNFTIYGRYAGVTTLFVTARQQSGLEILSQTIKVEVYNSPVMHPSDIFLVPGASYVVTVEGGPQVAAFVEYTSMNDSTVAVRESFGRLSAISPGTARIVATFYGNERRVLCQAYANVKVGIPTTAILNVQSEELCVGCDIPIFPLLSEGDLLSFYELCKNYKWTIEDEKVLSFHPTEDMHDNYRLPLSGHGGYQDEYDINFMKVLYGRSGGRSKVALTFSCDFPSPSSFSDSRSYSALVSIMVVPDPPLAQGIPITWILPPHYTTSNLLPAHSGSQSKRDLQSQEGTVSYSILGCCGRGDDELPKGIVSIFGSKIKTTESKNLACIQAKDHSTGRIEVASCVRVTEVAQIRFIRKSAMFVLNLAVGAKVELPLHYYDNLGNPFHEAHNVVAFNIESNYRDVLALDTVSQDNGSIIVKAVRHGRALVGVRMNGRVEKSDYIMISVGAHIHPQNPVLLPGSYVNFSVEGMDNQAVGQWSSVNESVLYVDSLSGRASAFGEGTTSVAFQSATMKLETTAKVMNRDIIFVDAPKDTLTNVFVPPEGYKFPVKFSVQKFGSRSKNVEVLYDCRVDPSFVGYTIPLRDLNTGESYCHFFPHNPEHLANFAPKSSFKRQDISISIHAKLREAHEVSGSATALFVGGFSVLDMNKDSLQLNLTPNSNRSILTILGNTDVGIHWLKRDVLIVRNLFKEAFRSNFEVKVLKPKSFRDKLIFTLPANGQRVEIDVSYDAGDTKATILLLTLWKGLAGCLALLILTFIIYKCLLDRPGGPEPLPTPAGPSDQAPRTPERHSPANSNEQSPRTPQPFMEYVRRTIDETPYYRRQGRRFDPQNTY
ncbi:nuclear pore complex protein GP210 isoform X2 [Silene latifolia]